MNTEKPMTEKQWLASINPEPMLNHLYTDRNTHRLAKGRRKLRLFACGCCRHVWHFIRNPASQHRAEIAEQGADGLADPRELADAQAEAKRTSIQGFRLPMHLVDVEPLASVTGAVFAADVVALTEVRVAVRLTSSLTALSVANTNHASPEFWETEVRWQADLLRCVFGNPFHPAAVDRAWLAWNDRTIVKLARAIYDERGFDRMPILADALEEAGCTNADILNHCRQAGEHVRGCFVLDSILGKQ